MKKIFALLLTLCLLAVSFAALAETAAETAPQLPAAVEVEDDSVFQGNWKLAKLNMMGQIMELETILDMFGATVPLNFTIADGKLISPNAEGVLEEIEYTFEDSKLFAEDTSGSYLVEALEDGTLAITLTTPDGMSMVLYCEAAE